MKAALWFLSPILGSDNRLSLNRIFACLFMVGCIRYCERCPIDANTLLMFGVIISGLTTVYKGANLLERLIKKDGTPGSAAQ